MPDIDIKFSEFPDGSNILPGDIVVGLRGGANAKFNADILVNPTFLDTATADNFTTTGVVLTEKLTTTLTTGDTISAAAIVNGMIYFNPPDANQAFIFPTAALLYAEIGSPAINQSFNFKFINLSAFPIGFFPGTNISLTGMPSNPAIVLNPLETWDLDLIVTQVTPSVLIKINGGQDSSFARIISGYVEATLRTNVMPQFPAYTPTEKYISSMGDNSNNGQIIAPYLTVVFADAAASAGHIVVIAEGPHSEPSIIKKTNVAWLGKGKNTTTCAVVGSITVNNAQWEATTNPYYDFANIEISATVALNLKPTTFVVGSSQFFNNTRIYSSTLGLCRNITFENCSEVLVNCTVSDVFNFKARSGTIFTATLTINVSAGAPAGATNIYDFEGCDLSACLIIINIADDTSAVTTLRTLGCRKPLSITINDNSTGGLTFYEFDASSYVAPSDVSGNLQSTYLDHSPGIYVDHTGVNYSSGVHVLEQVISAMDSAYIEFGLKFESISAATKQLEWNRDYYFTNAAQCVCTMPAGVTSVNSRMRLSSKTSGGFKIVNQSASQTIQFLDKTTVAGTTGYIETTGANQSISLVGDVSSILSTVTAAQGRVFNINTASGVETINGVGESLPIVVTGTSVSMLPRQEYILNNAALVTATLPTTMAVGDKIRIVGQGAGLWKIAQNASQSIVFLSQTTTSGTGGSITATQRYQCMEIECLTANTLFTVVFSSGSTYTVV